jgi:hypothetical protein
MIMARLLLRFYEAMALEKEYILWAFVKVEGLMPLLMKPRNYQKWTSEDKRELRLHLKRLSRVSPYIDLLVMPGGFVMLPVMAWWLDRRSSRRGAPMHSHRHAILIKDPIAHAEIDDYRASESKVRIG